MTSTGSLVTPGEPALDARQGGRERSGLGRHLLCDLLGCRSLPESVEPLRAEMIRAAELIGATVVQTAFNRFDPWGLSGVVILAESHMAVHTWPEHACACIDVFTCNLEMDPRPGFEHLRVALGAQEWELSETPRGRVRAAVSQEPRGPLGDPG